MFALMPLTESFDSFADFSAHWKTIRMKYNIAFLWLGALVNSSTQEVDVRTPVTSNTGKHQVRKSQQSRISPF